jgi:phosphatidylserine/phosphatidylglycerophosphate/cardiolipin synthase-like enzyme
VPLDEKGWWLFFQENLQNIPHNDLVNLEGELYFYPLENPTSMADFLTTSGTSHHIENIIMEARAKLVLVSPYLKLSKTFFERLKDASGKGVVIKIIYGKDELKPNERNSLAELKNAELYYFQNLHAKCFFNESKMVITSMNMYEFSEKTNREMGILIDRNNDKELFEKAMNQTFSILKSSEAVPLKKQERTPYKAPANNAKNRHQKNSQRGYCIRCEARIEYNPDRPFCTDCYTTWAQFENIDYPENVCHGCGEYEATSMAKPQCYTCYVNSEAKYARQN